MFLVVLTFVAVYFSLTERYKPSMLVMFPAFLVYFLVAGLQYGVGTDYFSYISIFEDESRHDFYFERKEYLFSYLNSLLLWLEMPVQSIFLAIAFIQASLVFMYFKAIKKKGFILFLFFVVFFCVTNIYNNQLNGLRQYVVITAMPLLTILLYEKRYVWFLVGLLLASFFHNTAWFLLFLVPICFLCKKYNRGLFGLFVLSAFCYFLLGGAVEEIVQRFLPSYSHYLKGDFAEGHSLVLFATKLYYLPLIFWFYLVYKKDNTDFGKYFHFMVVVFTLTFWFFIISLYLGIAERFYLYVVFFIAFPIYYLLHNSYKKRKLENFIAVMFYVIMPYVAKVTFLARGEFLYRSVLFAG